MKKKLLVALIAIFSSLFVLAFTSPKAKADSNGVINVHFYNSTGEYEYSEWGGKQNITWGAYYWIDTGRIAASVGDDPEFKREVDGKVNNGKLYTIHLNASETKAVEQGKKLGLIMVRSYIDELGYLTPYWNNNTGKDLSSDRFLDIKFNSNHEFDVWIIAGDKNNYLSLQQAKSAFERIESANFDDFDSLIIQTTKPITKETNITIYKVTDAINNSEGEVFMENLHASELWNEKKSAKITGLNLSSTFDWNADYQVFIEEVSAFKTSATKTRLYLSQKFKNECVPSNDTEFGAIYSAQKTIFRVWAPVSTNVFVNLYRNGNELDTTLYLPRVELEKKSKGIFEVTVNGDLNGVYYTYTNYVQGEENETIDIYAKSVGVNGNRAMVCNLDQTNPDGWSEDLTKATDIRNNKSGDAVIWEIHVRDFSISADSGMTYKGKYLAFTEENTHAKGSNVKTGIAYLKDLGINYVHLNPVFDFQTVDEEYINNTDYTTKQNWGYDPKNYNVPEGSYSTNATNGFTRINEFKQMVEALHNAGIGVIMDVVYNHTYTADSAFEKMVPGYYYRQQLSSDAGTFGYHAWTLNALGAYNLSDGSGCSNETASERLMFRDYMVDSLVYWANEYHVDGFRFDLMAIHDVQTMNDIRHALDNLPGGRGILLYGEPWAAGALGLDSASGQKSASSDNLNDLSSRIAAFNDRMREGIKGNNSGGTGYVQDNVTDNLHRVMAGINGLFLNYDGNGTISDAPSHTITYTTSHDNYTLWDQLINTTVKRTTPTMYSEMNSMVLRKNMMAAALTLTSKGTSFILAGEEIARTKYGNHNSYNAQDKINAFDYNRQIEFESLYNWYKSLIDLRVNKFQSIARGSNQANVKEFYGCLVYTFSKEVSSDIYNKVTVICNPKNSNFEIKFNEISGANLDGTWTLIANEKGFNFAGYKTVSGTVTLPKYSTYILVQ
ncbi:MAG: type I pullulanase [Gammaproteobacteria bacterium]|nr:type I pullulanase [Gammaproteobacteria bacterium]